MYYLICEGNPDGQYNASSKARKDVEEIAVSEGFERAFVKTKYGVQKKKIKKIFQYITYIKNNMVWNKFFKNYKKGDIFLFQYPLLNTTFNFEKILKKYKSKYKFVGLVHDMDSLRYDSQTTSSNSLKRFKKEDKKILNNCHYIISHNFSMTNELIKLGNNKKNIFNLELFDYLYNEKIDRKTNKNYPIIIAGNLSTKKTRYLKDLNKVEDINFNLYGLGYEEKNFSNVKYKGAFLPEELLKKLDGSFGLVWDGNSINSCEGPFGNYLRFNNPHKASMYIAAEIPIIVWKEAAISKIVQEKNIGISINSLKDLKKSIDRITDDDYQLMVSNVRKLGNDLRNGNFLRNILRKIKRVNY